MTSDITMSSKGQIVIPRTVREALKLAAGSRLRLTRVGKQIVLEVSEPRSERPEISYEEFRSRVPRYRGSPATIEDMDAAVDRMFAERGRP